MKIIANFFITISVIYAIGCTTFLSINSPSQYYNTAYVSVAVMIVFLLLRGIYVIIKNSNNDNKKSEINNTIMFLMYYFTGVFELNIKYGYGNTIGISGVDEKIGLLYTMGLPYKICNLLNILIFILTWIILILKFRYKMNHKKMIKNKTIILLIIIGVFFAVKSTIGVLISINDNNAYVDIIMAHIIYWFVYFISIITYKVLSKKSIE